VHTGLASPNVRFEDSSVEKLRGRGDGTQRDPTGASPLVTPSGVPSQLELHHSQRLERQSTAHDPSSALSIPSKLHHHRRQKTQLQEPSGSPSPSKYSNYSRYLANQSLAQLQQVCQLQNN
jgi:hypothetical protein